MASIGVGRAMGVCKDDGPSDPNQRKNCKSDTRPMTVERRTHRKLHEGKGGEPRRRDVAEI